MRTYSFFLFFGLGKKSPNISLRFTDVFIQDLWTVYNLGLTGVQHFSNLARYQSFSGSGRAVKKNTFDVFATYGAVNPHEIHIKYPDKFP
jgi:hypothetical protein